MLSYDLLFLAYVVLQVAANFSIFVIPNVFSFALTSCVNGVVDGVQNYYFDRRQILVIQISISSKYFGQRGGKIINDR